MKYGLWMGAIIGFIIGAVYVSGNDKAQNMVEQSKQKIMNKVKKAPMMQEESQSSENTQNADMMN